MYQVSDQPHILETVWRFARGDMPASEFEDWLYAHAQAELQLGEDAYLEAISLDYRNTRQVAEFRSKLGRCLPRTSECRCEAIPDWGLVTLGRWTSEGFEHIEQQEHTPYWLQAMICKTCKTHWIVGQDNIIYDVWIVVRATCRDISRIKTYRGLLSQAIRSGAMVGYEHPMQSVELPWAIKELAQETPGISVTEMTALLPADREVVMHHARAVLSQGDVSIDLEE